MTKKIVVYNLVGHRFLGVNEQGDKVMIDGDQPATGPRPMELLLMALGACTAYDVVDIMKKKKQPLAATGWRWRGCGRRPTPGATPTSP
jgi:putative redox protein